ncbi:hypothetical protein FXN61_25490 [Lentzea sp. PSKA42]|uniref:Uncharacterized protein n=1 Tax=Lentzea indica TaxID=2604800 RepID=A0ABX1FM29_9PSEU|nr:hypothetical protein [Lentzea indica]NKE59970.1 hypothetical protein [Lentzea indica]
MTDWSQLTHAYGTAEDIPGLLDRVATSNDSEAWDELWSALCHQGTTYPASYAALPHLAGIDDVMAVVLAGAIVADGGDEVRAEHAASVTKLLVKANELLPGADEGTYAYLLESVLAFEGLTDSADALSWGVANEEYEIECPGCGVPILILISDGVSRADDCADRPLRPADAAALDGIGRRLCETATSHGQERVARVFRHVFGQATCPACETVVTVSEQIL